MRTAPKLITSFDDYLRDEAKRNQRHELIDGQVWAMVGTTLNHNLIAGNVYSNLKANTRSCSVFIGDVKVRVGDNAFYPDVLASCGIHDGKANFLTDPCVIVEVSSPSTATFDRTFKLKQYRRIKTLESYLLVSSEAQVIDVYQRAGDLLVYQTYSNCESIPLPCLGLELSVDAVYAGLGLPTLDELIAMQRELGRERD